MPMQWHSLLVPLLRTPVTPLGPIGHAHGVPDHCQPNLTTTTKTASIVAGAILNNKVSLACDISPPTADDSVALVLWYKDDSLAPIYTVDARKANSLERAKTSIDDHYESRLSFNLRSKPAQLVLDQVQREDEADYRCRVDFRRGRTVNTIISLRVIVPPEELYIVSSSKPQHRLTGLIGPFDEGSPLELICVANGGKPRPQISWRRDYQSMDGDTQSIDKNGTSVTLKIGSLNKSHLLSLFTCQASNSNLTQPLQTSITLDLNLKPQEISLRRINADQGPLIVGQSATFECLTHGSRPKANVYWLFDGKRLDPPMNVDQQQTSSRLTLTLERAHNQRPLTCVAENPRIRSIGNFAEDPAERADDGDGETVGATSAGKTGAASPSASTLEQTLKLDVHYAPQLSIQVEPQAPQPAQLLTQQSQEAAQTAIDPSRLQEGNDIYLTCRLDANPRPSKPILWRFSPRASLTNATQQQSYATADQTTRSNSAQVNGATTGQVQTTTLLNSLAANNPMIVLNNQSLVLRKVTRHQSGDYTCESQNQHGASVSAPVSLQIRYAPVCATSDILVFEAGPSQIIDLDCQVQANPLRSVHFSWFVAYGSGDYYGTGSGGSGPGKGNGSSSLSSSTSSALPLPIITNWLQRDVTVDEQIDESSRRLRLRVRQDGFALVKCKAKNEIGLQQRPCLFQIVRATRPILRHTCSIYHSPGGAPPETGPASAPAQRQPAADTIQVQCKPNEHLKSEPTDLVSISAPGEGSSAGNGAGRSNSNESAAAESPMRGWLNLEAIRSASASSSEMVNAAADSGQQPLPVPNFRLVYPPAWLLVELYELGPASGASGVSGTLAPVDRTSEETDTEDRLVAYVVVGVAGQLGRIKQIIESSGLLSANPKSAYYVMARPIEGTGAGNGSLSESTSEPINLFSTRTHSALMATAAVLNQSPQVIEDSSVQLGDSFTFKVPSLKPDTRYKLVVYGQNLANKTRDLVVLRAATGNEPTSGSTFSADNYGGDSESNNAKLVSSSSQFRRRQQQQVGDTDAAAGLMSDAAVIDNSNGTLGKSLVMRSELNGGSDAFVDLTTVNDAGTSIYGGGASDQASSRSQQRPNSEKPNSWIDVARSKMGLSASHIAAYKDFAMSYVRQKPLVAIPVVVSALVAIGSLALWLSATLVHSLRRSGSARQAGAPTRRRNSNSRRGSKSKDKYRCADEHNDDDEDDEDDLMNANGSASANDNNASKYLLANGNGSGSSMNDSSTTKQTMTTGSSSVDRMTTLSTTLLSANNIGGSNNIHDAIGNGDGDGKGNSKCSGYSSNGNGNSNHHQHPADLVHYCMSSPSEQTNDATDSFMSSSATMMMQTNQHHQATVAVATSNNGTALLLMHPMSSSTASLSPISLQAAGSANVAAISGGNISGSNGSSNDNANINASSQQQVYTIEPMLGGPEVMANSFDHYGNHAHPHHLHHHHHQHHPYMDHQFQQQHLAHHSRQHLPLQYQQHSLDRRAFVPAAFVDTCSTLADDNQRPGAMCGASDNQADTFARLLAACNTTNSFTGGSIDRRAGSGQWMNFSAVGQQRQASELVLQANGLGAADHLPELRPQLHFRSTGVPTSIAASGSGNSNSACNGGGSSFSSTECGATGAATSSMATSSAASSIGAGASAGPGASTGKRRQQQQQQQHNGSVKQRVAFDLRSNSSSSPSMTMTARGKQPHPIIAHGANNNNCTDSGHESAANSIGTNPPEATGNNDIHVISAARCASGKANRGSVDIVLGSMSTNFMTSCSGDNNSNDQRNH